jgi:hypothetical protein
MKINSSIQVLIILMVVMFFVSGPVAAAPPKPAAATSAAAPAVINQFKPVASVDEATQDVGRDDSVVVISGKIDMGGADYYGVYPQIVCDTKKNPGEIQYFVIGQRKSNASAGYKLFFIFRDTNKNPQMWKYFLEFNQLTIEYGNIAIQKTKDAKWEYWDTAAPSLPKTYSVGSVQYGNFLIF